MEPVRMTDLIAKMRDLQAQAGGRIDIPGDQARPDSFAEVLAQSVNSVNDTQRTAERMATAFEVGDPNVDLVEVMVATQKAGIAFQAMTQVRNQLVRAYQEVMNMPI